MADLIFCQFTSDLAVPQRQDAIGALLDLTEPMGNIDNRYAVGF